MTIENENDLEALKRIGAIVAQTLQAMGKALEPGMTTRELDAIGAALLEREGARPAPALTYDFPGATCISVFPDIAHGIPGDRVLKAGDLVNIDVSAELNGYFADTGSSFVMPPKQARLERLARDAQGFIYAVSMTGTTGHSVGAAGHVPPATLEYLDRVRRLAKVPVCAGFGIRSREQVARLAGHVDGVVVGSALVEVLERGEDPAAWLRGLRQGGE